MLPRSLPLALLLAGVLPTGGVCADEPVPPTQSAAEQRWFDKAHSLLSGSARDSARWFDGFFGPDEEADQAEGFLRLRLQQRYIERDSDELKLRASASYYLPKTKQRLKLLVESDEDEDPLTADTSDDGSDGSTRAALRWTPLDRQNWDLAFDVGVTLDSGLDPFARTRARYFHALDERTVIRLSQELKVELQDSWTETSRVVIDRVYQRVGYRVESRGRYGEETDGMEWILGLYRTVKLDKKTAFSGFVILSGATDDEDEQSENTRLGVNLRRNVLRQWLFFEVEPQVSWPRKYDYHSNGELRLVLEAQFGTKR